MENPKQFGNFMFISSKVQQANQSVPTGDSPPPSIFPKKFRRCRPNEIEIIDPFECWPCPTCPPGSGLSPPCGSLFSGRTLILCKSCDPGKTFSSTWGGTSCKRCSQCAPNETVVRPCQSSSDVVCSRCQPDQITWISSKREKHECLDCPICPPGFEPSHPCGSTVPYGVLITCVQCREGDTFSAMTDRQQCKRCSPCGRRQRLISRCTKYFDTICGSISLVKCGYDQIQLNQLDSLNRTEITCMDCPICPAGTELSQPCGTVAYKEIDLFCVSCRPGFTFSDQPSKYGCKPCTSCSPDTVVISHCSVLKDTACSANSRCSSNQISFSNGSTRTCIDCIECSVGEEPSIACGSLVTVLPRQQCMSCKPGTFSDIYGTQPCRPCRSCDKEESVKRKCRQASDTVCLLCEANEYFDHELWSCAPCSICCKDEEDHFPQECSHLTIRKCKLRMCLSNTFSAKVLPATTMETSTAVSAATVRTSLSKYSVLTLVTLVSTVALILTGFVTLVYVRLRLRQRQLQLTFRKTRTKRWRDVAGKSYYLCRVSKQLSTWTMFESITRRPPWGLLYIKRSGCSSEYLNYTPKGDQSRGGWSII